MTGPLPSPGRHLAVRLRPPRQPIGCAPGDDVDRPKPKLAVDYPCLEAVAVLELKPPASFCRERDLAVPDEPRDCPLPSCCKLLKHDLPFLQNYGIAELRFSQSPLLIETGCP